MKKQNIFLLASIVLAVIGSYIYFTRVRATYTSITSFKACVDAGFLVLTTYPEQCKMPGKVFLNPNQTQEATTTPIVDSASYTFKNDSYIVEGQSIIFENGLGILPPNMLLKRPTSTLRILPGEFMFDINQDSTKDTVFMITTGTSSMKQSAFYISALLSLNTGFVGLNALYVSNALASSTFVYKNGEIVLIYTETASSTPKERYFILESDILKERTSRK